MDFLEFPGDHWDLPYWKVAVRFDEEGIGEAPLCPDNELTDDISIPEVDHGDNLVDASIIGSNLDNFTGKLLIYPWFYKPNELEKVDLPEINPNERVVKIGARTGYTEGRVLDPSYDEWFGSKLFRDQIHSTILVRSGDSGSILLNENHCPVGLIFANGQSGFCLANKLSNLNSEYKSHYGIEIQVYAPKAGYKKDIESELEKLHENDHDPMDYRAKMDDLE